MVRKSEYFIEGRERYKHVKTVIPNDFYLTLDIKGQRLTFYHGHMTGGGGNIENKNYFGSSSRKSWRAKKR